ncbi:MAG: hypothetical protein JW793_10160 [Acidobacteria bacterium]|nr:hypothetical protein [Acidobacteriota bacterium]
MEKLDTVLQDAKALLKAAGSYAAGDDEPGIGRDLIDDLAGAVERAAAADITQRNAIREAGRLTETQDKAMAHAIDQIRKVRFAGKACYKKAEKQILKEFNVGKASPKTVKAAIGDLRYLRDAANKHLGDLARAGFRAADLAAVEKSMQALEAADVSQELAKKKQKEATRSRDEAYRELKEACRQVRSAAKAVFMGRPGVLVVFESTVRARKRRASKPGIVVEKSARVVTAV